MNLLRWTLSFLRPYRASVVAITALSIVEVALGALAPWPLKIVIDSVLGEVPLPAALASLADRLLGPNPVALLVAVAIGGLLLQLLLELVLTWHTQLQVTTGQRIVYDLRRRLLDHLLALGLRHHIVTRTADSVYRLESDAYCVNDLAMGGVFPLAISALKLTVMFAILAELDLALALLSLAVVPFLYASLRYYSTRMVDRAEKVKEAESSLVERMFEVLSSVRVVKSFAREGHEIARFTAVGNETMRARLRLTWQESLFGIALSVITLVGTALILTVGGMHVLDGSLTVGSLLVVLAYLAAVYTPLSSIAHTAGSLQQAVASARRVREVFAIAPESDDPAVGLDASAATGELRFDQVRFAYEAGRPILDGISFVARPGELVALVGLTGAGKSTLASLIPRFFEPTGGCVLLDGVDVRCYSLTSLREQVALVPQDAVLFGTTIADNIRYGRLTATDAEVRAAAEAAHVDHFIARLPQGYDTPLGEAGGTLSGGERQRLSIARALLKNARILVLDEPTSSLDAISEEAVFSALGRLRAGRTTIVIAHRLSTIRDADRILVLHEGRLVAEGRHEALLAGNDLYRRMCARLALGRSLDEPASVDEVMHAL
ncbi:MAG: ABC transporter ATP-binding protein [Acidobacteria bacterium]|nr:ABC transporter ATP-binding protein [Acidobacteriota bacterium]